MSRYDDGGWPAYVPVAERRRKAEREAAKLRKKGHPVTPVRIEGRAIATTAWGQAWCHNLESYRDYESRLPRGRTYVRNGWVIDLQIGPCEIKALVSGSSIYQVTVGITSMPAARWRSICADCSGRIDSLVELLQGRLSKGVMDRMCRQGSGLFPSPSEIRFSCNCEDHASMCKHVAAVLYGVGARLDENPELLFRLRAVNADDLLADLDRVMPASKSAGAKVLAAADVSALFGLNLAGLDRGDDSDDAGTPKPTSSRDAPARCSKRTARAGPSRPVPPKALPLAAAPTPKARSARVVGVQTAAPKSKTFRPAAAQVASKRTRPSASPSGSGAPTTEPSVRDRAIRAVHDPAAAPSVQSPGRKQRVSRSVKPTRET